MGKQDTLGLFTLHRSDYAAQRELLVRQVCAFGYPVLALSSHAHSPYKRGELPERIREHLTGTGKNRERKRRGYDAMKKAWLTKTYGGRYFCHASQERRINILVVVCPFQKRLDKSKIEAGIQSILMDHAMDLTDLSYPLV